MFGGQKHIGNEDIMVLVCHMILQDHVIKALYNCGKSPPIVSHHPAWSGDHGHCGCGDIMVLVCHVILQDHVTKGSGNFISRDPSRGVTYCQV